jgi:hypothetical protein
MATITAEITIEGDPRGMLPGSSRHLSLVSDRWRHSFARLSPYVLTKAYGNHAYVSLLRVAGETRTELEPARKKDRPEAVSVP